MNNSSKTFKLRYTKYINDITEKRTNPIMIVSIVLLSILMYLDIIIRDNIIAVYTRIPSLTLAISLLFIKNFKLIKNKTLLTVLYNIFLVTILAMMYAKFLVHINTDTAVMNILSIITAIFIISLEIRSKPIYTIIIYILPLLFFLIILFSFFSFDKEEVTPLINVLLMTIVGFTVNRIQNNLRLKNYQNSSLLKQEKQKLNKSNKELRKYQNKLEYLVEEKTKALQTALVKAKESDSLKTSFLQNISHEIRTPMNASLGFIHLLAEKNPDIKKEADIIDDNLNQLLETIDNIILLSELLSDQFEIKSKDQSVYNILKNSINYLNSLIEKSSKSLKPILNFKKENDFIINTDKEKVIKIINLVLENAVKFSESGEIKISCLKKGKNAHINISDIGSGILKEDIPHIFDIFRKFENKENIFRGVGIGLSIAKKLTNIIKGTIIAKSNIGEGTTIEIIIPKK